MLSEELTPGGDPKRARLLGEDLVAFRDESGRASLIDEACPHRGASMALARNEPGGLRCLYHGWKVECDGTIGETPAEPEEFAFKDRVRALVYPTYESGGLLWAYMGPAGSLPSPMNFHFTQVDDASRHIIKAQVECNWVQCLEGVIDSSHTNFLHANGVRAAADVSETIMGADFRVARPSADVRPRMECEDTAYGFRYAAIRKPILNAETMKYVRTTHFVAPIYAIFPPPKNWTWMQAFVPIDDEHTMFYFMQVRNDGPVDAQERARIDAGAGLQANVDLDTAFRKIRSRANNWLQDREAMKRGDSYTGIRGVNMEDHAIQESMGPIYDRTKEHLGTSDIAIIRMRRILLDSVRKFSERADPPIGLDVEVAYDKIRAEERIIPIDAPWQIVGAVEDSETVAASLAVGNSAPLRMEIGR